MPGQIKSDSIRVTTDTPTLHHQPMKKIDIPYRYLIQTPPASQTSIKSKLKSEIDISMHFLVRYFKKKAFLPFEQRNYENGRFSLFFQFGTRNTLFVLSTLIGPVNLTFFLILRTPTNYIYVLQDRNFSDTFTLILLT